MATIVVLFNLKPGASVTEYEQWARERDIPTVRSLGSVSDFRLLRMENLLGTEAPSPYRYCELIEVPDMDAFFADLGREDVQTGAKAFAEFADNPLFIVSNPI